MKNGYQKINEEFVDGRAEQGCQWTVPVSHEEYAEARKGNWQVKLTPVRNVPKEWFGDLKGKRVLGLASGGGQQIPLLTAAGAECTVFDLSGKQIESDLLVAEREGYAVNAIQGDMTKIFPFEDESFDLVFQPVSFCYIQDVRHVIRECHRVLKKGGVYLLGAPTEILYAVDLEEKEVVNTMPYDPLVNEEYRKELEEYHSGMQFSHTLEELIGEQLKAGFCLTDLYEDTSGAGRLHELNIKTYIAARTVKK